MPLKSPIPRDGIENAMGYLLLVVMVVVGGFVWLKLAEGRRSPRNKPAPGTQPRSSKSSRKRKKRRRAKS